MGRGTIEHDSSASTRTKVTDMPSTCPACGTPSPSPADTVAVADQVAGYRQPGLGLDVARLMAGAPECIELHHCVHCHLRWFDPMQPGDSQFYEDLQRHDWYYQDNKPEYAEVAAEIAPRSRVLEVGCGKGAFAGHLAAGVHYRGLEFNERAIALAKQSGLDVSGRTIEDEALSAHAAYDAVCHFQVLEHVPATAAFMRACVAALRPGGRLMVTVPAEDSYLGIAPRGWLNMPPHHVTRWSDLALRNVFSSLGVRVDRLWHEPVADYHQQEYEAVLAHWALRQCVGVPTALASPRTHVDRLADRLLRVPALRRWLAARGEARFTACGRGHSVTIFGTRAQN